MPPQTINEPQFSLPALPKGHKAAHVPRLSDLDTRGKEKLKDAVTAAREWGKVKRDNPDSNISLVLLSRGVNGDNSKTGYGVGKTHIARCLCWSRCIAFDGVPVAHSGLFVMADELVRDYQSILKALREKKPHVIVIDDVGMEKKIEYIADKDQDGERRKRYFSVINYCYDTGNGTGISVVITGNLSVDGLWSRIGGQAFDRLSQMAPKDFIRDLTGTPSWRKKAGGR